MGAPLLAAVARSGAFLCPRELSALCGCPHPRRSWDEPNRCLSDCVPHSGMFLGRRSRLLFLAGALYLAFCALAGIYLADATLHPACRPLTQGESSAFLKTTQELNAEVADVSITTMDNVTLRAWLIRPRETNHDAVLLLHGQADNRLGMSGYAKLLLGHGYSVLLPDARAHGSSGGSLATYGLVERDDIHQWVDFLQSREHPRCIFGFGESMGAAQLLQSLDTHPGFCAVAAESPFSTFREIAYDRMGQPFHTGPWFGRTVFRPIVEISFLRARWKYGLDMRGVSPEDSVAATAIPVLLIHGQVDSNIPVRHSRAIRARKAAVEIWEVPNADHCGAIASAPQEFERRLLQWFSRPRSQT